MSFPSVLSVTETEFTSNTTSHPVAMPPSVNSGDLLLCIFASDGGPTHTAPSGWTPFAGATGAGVGAWVRAKISDGTEGGTTVDFETGVAERAVAQVYRITGWAYNTDLTQSIAVANWSGSADPPSLNPSNWGTEDALWFAVHACDAGAVWSGTPTNYTNSVTSDSTTTTAGVAINTVRRELNTSSENPGAFALSSGTSRMAGTVAVLGGVIGQVAATLPGITASGSGNQQSGATGTGAAALPSLTASGSGSQSHVATGAPSLPSLTASATGTQTTTGSGAAALGSLTASATGAMQPSATAAATLPSLTGAGQGTHTVTGSSAASLPGLTTSGVGTQTITGTSASSVSGTVDSGTNDGGVGTRDADYETARAGGSAVAADTSNFALSTGDLGGSNLAGIGQIEFVGSYFLGEGFVSFDLSGLTADTISSASLSLYASSFSGTFTVEARLYDWGATLTAADWVPGADLGDYPLLATLASTDITTSAQNAFTENGTALRDAIASAAGGTLSILLATDTLRTGAAVGQFIQFHSADNGTSENNPKLSYEYAVSPSLPSLTVSGSGLQSGEPTASAAAELPSLTASGSGVQTHSGSGAAALASLTAAASGVMVPSGAGAAALPSLTADAEGAQSVEATGAATLPALAASASGEHDFT